MVDIKHFIRKKLSCDDRPSGCMVGLCRSRSCYSNHNNFNLQQEIKPKKINEFMLGICAVFSEYS